MQSCAFNRSLYMVLVPVAPIVADVKTEICRVSADDAGLLSRWVLPWTSSLRRGHVSMALTASGEPHLQDCITTSR